MHALVLSLQQSVERPVARHESPVQQVLVVPAVHALPLAVQAAMVQCPPVQVFPVQHCDVAVQTAPVAVQAAVWQVPAVQVSPVQHAEVAVHVAPAAAQVVAARQVPLWQVRPVQQSASAAHGEVLP